MNREGPIRNAHILALEVDSNVFVAVIIGLQKLRFLGGIRLGPFSRFGTLPSNSSFPPMSSVIIDDERMPPLHKAKDDRKSVAKIAECLN